MEFLSVVHKNPRPLRNSIVKVRTLCLSSCSKLLFSVYPELWSLPSAGSRRLRRYSLSLFPSYVSSSHQLPHLLLLPSWPPSTFPMKTSRQFETSSSKTSPSRGNSNRWLCHCCMNEWKHDFLNIGEYPPEIDQII